MDQPAEYAILDHLREGCQVIGFDRRYRYVNAAAARHGRTTPTELIGKKMTDLYPGVEATTMYAFLERCLDQRLPAEFENEFTFANGTRAWFTIKMDPVPEGAFILSIDISDRKHAEDALQEHVTRLEALRAIDLAIVATGDLTSTLEGVLERVVTSLHVDAADLLLYRPERGTLEYVAGCGFRQAEAGQTVVPFGQGLAGRTAFDRRAVIIEDLGRHPEPPERGAWFADEGFVFYAAIPLVTKGNPIGLFEVFHRTALTPSPDWIEFLHALGAQASIAIDHGRLYRDLQRVNLDLTLAYERTIEGWSYALDLRDRETKGHTLRVTALTVRLARLLGTAEDEITHIRRGALLHDIGKMGIPDTILLKPGPLTDDEWKVMRMHPTYARDLLYPIEYLRPCLPIPYAHHEKWDGSGYPLGLKDEQIPLAARLFAVVDVWDALSSNRPYRPAWTQTEVFDHIQGQAGIHFDPQIVEVFLRERRARSA